MRNLQIYKYVDTIVRTGSIRKAAEQLFITPSALNRRILALEEELGMEIFERLGRGVRLNPAGELIIFLFRRQLSEVERLKSQLADLTGVRRGKVSIVCSQALLPYFLPKQIYIYQKEFPGVTFDIKTDDGEAAADALQNYKADLALVFEPFRSTDYQTLITVRQPIHAVMAKNHPLSNDKKVSLAECKDYPLALPSYPYAVRNILETAADRSAVKLYGVVEAESYIFLRNFVMLDNAIFFELKIGVPPDLIENTIVSIPLSVPTGLSGFLHLTQLRGRTLPVASARFADQLSKTFEADVGSI